MKKKNIVFTVIALVLIAATLVVGITACKKTHKGDDVADQPTKVSEQEQSISTPGDKLSIDPSAGDYVPPETSEAPVGSGIAIPGWGHINLPAGKKDVAVNFPNPDANADKYYLTFKLELKDTGEVLYSSGLVPPGQTIQNITLSRALEAGDHNAIVHVQPYKMDAAQTPTNNADMETLLVVA